MNRALWDRGFLVFFFFFFFCLFVCLFVERNESKKVG